MLVWEVSRKIQPELRAEGAGVTWVLCVSRPRPTPQLHFKQKAEGFRPPIAHFELTLRALSPPSSGQRKQFRSEAKALCE